MNWKAALIAVLVIFFGIPYLIMFILALRSGHPQYALLLLAPVAGLAVIILLSAFLAGRVAKKIAARKASPPSHNSGQKGGHMKRLGVDWKVFLVAFLAIAIGGPLFVGLLMSILHGSYVQVGLTLLSVAMYAVPAVIIGMIAYRLRRLTR